MGFDGAQGGGVGISSESIFQARIQRDSATQLSIQRYLGNIIAINGESFDPGASGIPLLTTDNLITADGADAGVGMSANTLYYLYTSNTSATVFPSDLRASTTAWTLFNGVRYLGTSGNAANWRFAGYAHTNNSTQFVDSLVSRRVINYYNRRKLRLLQCPQYVDNDATTSYTFTASLTWARLNGGTDDSVDFISNGEDPWEASYKLTASVGSVAPLWTIGENSTSAVVNASLSDAVNYVGSVVKASGVFAEGLRTLYMMAATSGLTNNLTVHADSGIAVSDADPRLTYLEAFVMG